MTKAKKRDIATSFTTLIFIIIGGTGILMFFHLFDNYTKKLHEIIGLFFVGVVLFHVFFNWNSMKSYFSKKIFLFAAIITFTLSTIFVGLNTSSGANPKGELIGKMLKANLDNSLAVLGISLENANKKLQEVGIEIENAKSIEEIAKSNNKSPFDIVNIILK